MRLFLVVRHGQSLFNIDKVVNGDPALDRGLSEEGIEEAQRLAGQLAALPIDLVAVSPFPRALQTANQVSLADLVETYPIEQGLAELVTYLSLAAEDRLALIDDTAKQTVSWIDAEGIRRQATLPQVIFTRRAA